MTSGSLCSVAVTLCSIWRETRQLLICWSSLPLASNACLSVKAERRLGLSSPVTWWNSGNGTTLLVIPGRTRRRRLLTITWIMYLQAHLVVCWAAQRGFVAPARTEGAEPPRWKESECKSLFVLLHMWRPAVKNRTSGHRIIRVSAAALLIKVGVTVEARSNAVGGAGNSSIRLTRVAANQLKHVLVKFSQYHDWFIHSNQSLRLWLMSRAAFPFFTKQTETPSEFHQV